MEITNEGNKELNDDTPVLTTQITSPGYDNGIGSLEVVQETSKALLAKCHSKQQPDDLDLGDKNDSNGESRIERDSLEKEIDSDKTVKSPGSLAFTIDFGGNKQIDSAKYNNLFQRYNARHKRNLSTSKIEIKSKPVTDLSPNCMQKHKPLSIHSEGYFSSEDDSKRKADRLSQKLKELGLKNTKGATKKSDLMSKSMTENTNGETKRRSYHEESMNNCTYEITYSATMNDLSKMQSNVEEELNRVQYSPEKKYTKNIEYIEINHDYSEEIEKSSLDTVEKLSNTSYLSDNCPSNEFASSSSRQTNVQMMSVSYTGESSGDFDQTNLEVFNVSTVDAGSDGTVSEAGTYTIHKDYTDEEKARMDIDKTFSVGVLTEEESNELYVHHFKMRSSRDTNTWITEWATQVAEHNSLPPVIGGTSGRTPPMSPSKIPSPIYSRNPRASRSRYEQSDSSLDAEVQQMRDRIISVSNNNNQHTLIDSGGESDEDTSNSYNTPPHSSQRTPTHSALVRRGSLSESLFKRANHNDCRRSMRKYPDVNKKEEILDVPKSPSHVLARLHLERGNSLDRKSDTGESNSSRRSSLKNYITDDNFKHTNSPILNRIRTNNSVTYKLTNSPILGHKNITTKILNSPSFERPKQLLVKSNSQAKNVGYFTCVENSPYMLRKSNSTSNYREDTSPGIKELSVLNNSSSYQRNPVGIQRSSSNTSIRNAKTKSMLARRSSFNDQGERLSKAKHIVSDSSSEAGETHNVPAPPISSGIKLNRAFSIRRARVTCDSDTTPNTTPEERRRKAQLEIKSAPSSARQQSHHRGRTSSVGASNKDNYKKPDARPRVPSLSRNEGGRYSMRGQKSTSSASASRPSSGVKVSKEPKNSGRSNSTLTSKEVEFQNWKRRKNYDPMKAAAEGKKKLDTSRKHHSIEDGSNSRDSSVLRSASFHGTRGALSLADDWSDNELNFVEQKEIIQIPPPCSPRDSDSDLDTSSYLQTTQNVMSAMSARITVYQPAPVDSGGESDEDTSQSLRQTNKLSHQVSDTESSDDPQLGSKFNRSYGLRKPRVQEVKSAPIKTRAPVVNSRAKSETASIARTDSGRFSMRSKGSTATGPKAKPKDVKKQSQSLAREQEMQNWKRRKSYDPMKAAMEGKKKAGLVKKNLNSESSSVLRSQSFHGPVNFGISEWSDEDVSASADEAPIY
ncbi:uncharacterized protein LOC130666423 isoform X1 [Microplitis mediator]|uniref:uncharacterized protein LOC130666423 isoform X1 n=1 Tax=Microplitis mediator TaxID=375433 RepID=UPI00255678C5|nr:uncharacterized protein LOC130666423 isoform X1 [Microplitis mediator]